MKAKNQNPPAGTENIFRLKRREFLKFMSGGILVTFLSTDPLDVMAMAEQREIPDDFNAFLLIKEDGTVEGYTGKIEMGQGIITSLAQMLAEELEVPYENVRMVMGDTELCPFDRGTFGSMTTRFFAPHLRAAAAEARTILIGLGSEKLEVPSGKLKVKAGYVYEEGNENNRVSYAELTKGKKIQKHLKGEPELESYRDFNLVGKPKFRKDAYEKVTGKARYSGDISIPGLKYARILRPPSHGAKLKSIDISGAEKIEGAEIFREGDFVAVLHDSPDMADVAIIKMKADYTFDEMPVNDRNIFDHLLKVAGMGDIVFEDGNLEEGRKISDKIIEREYHDGYVAHAPIEPHTATAVIEGDKITVWASSQSPFRTQEEVAREIDFPLENVRVIASFLGGGFGGKTSNLQAREAARLAKMSGKPVQVMWRREDEFFNDTFRPAAAIKITSGISGEGKMQFWDYHQYFAGQRGSDLLYEAPHRRNLSYTEDREKAHPFGTGAWRAPGNNTNTFARASQIDIMAFEAGMDPLEFRLKNLEDQRMVEVLKAAADLFGWTPAKAPSGRGYGIAVGTDAGTYVASMAEVKVNEKTGEVKVIRVACAQDMGRVINPEGATIQMEGCITMGLGYALTEEILFDGGKIHNENFDSYTIPVFSWLPEIKTKILNHPEADPQGGGEPAIITMGGVIANAIFDATGARLYHLPMTPERVLNAIKTKK